jgi:hypothetical protein
LNHFTTVRPQNRYKIAIFGFWFYLNLSNILLSPDSQAIPWFVWNQSWPVGSSDLPLLNAKITWIISQQSLITKMFGCQPWPTLNAWSMGNHSMHQQSTWA